MDIIEKARKAAKENNIEIKRIFNVGSDEIFEIVTMTTPESEVSGDGFDDVIFGVNKKTNQEAFSTFMGLPNENGFEELDYNSLTYTEYNDI